MWKSLNALQYTDPIRNLKFKANARNAYVFLKLRFAMNEGIIELAHSIQHQHQITTVHDHGWTGMGEIGANISWNFVWNILLCGDDWLRIIYSESSERKMERKSVYMMWMYFVIYVITMSVIKYT